MRIGLDLDGTVYAHPRFFAALIEAMTAQGHECLCVTGHSQEEWPAIVERLKRLGVPADKLSPRLVRSADMPENLANKLRMCRECDVVFDDDALLWGELPAIPVFVTPRVKAEQHYYATREHPEWR